MKQTDVSILFAIKFCCESVIKFFRRNNLSQKQREEERKRRQEAESAPPAVSEMLNILGTMRRRAKPVKQNLKTTDPPT